MEKIKTRYLVSNCHDCPFCNNDREEGYSCNHPHGDIEDYELTRYDSKFLPTNCALRDNKITIGLKSDHTWKR